jgi:hypothetical protein
MMTKMVMTTLTRIPITINPALSALPLHYKYGTGLFLTQQDTANETQTAD